MSRARELGSDSNLRAGTIEIRPATVADTLALSELAARTFRDTFADQNTPEDMQAHVEATFSVERVAGEIEDSAAVVLLAIDGPESAPVGYAKVQAGSANEFVETSKPIELERLYVERSHQRSGIGGYLMHECLAEAERSGAETIWLGVWERNQRAIEFYRRWGFAVVGTQVFRLGSDDQTDLVMARRVTGRPTTPGPTQRSLSDQS